MGHVLKSLAKGVSALTLIVGLAVRFAPATEAEAAALGPNHTRTDLMQKRLAWAAMKVAPEATVRVYAEASGVPEIFVRQILESVAAGEPITQAGEPITAAEDPATPAPLPDGRRIEAGGALFVSAGSDD